MSFEEQLMPKDKYHIFCTKWRLLIVFISLQIFFTTCAVLKIGEYPWIALSFTCGIFGLVMHLDLSHTSKNF